MLIFDGDYPMAALAMDLRRDVTLPIDELRKRDRDYENIAMASLPEMRRAGMAVAILKVVSDMQREGATIKGTNQPHRTYAIGKGQVGYYDALEAQGELRIIRTRGDLTGHMAEWEAAPTAAGREDCGSARSSASKAPTPSSSPASSASGGTTASAS